MTAELKLGPKTHLENDEQELYEQHVVARLFDFFSDRAPWQRRLWDAGTVMGLKEIQDAAVWADSQVLRPAAVKWLGRDLLRILGKDKGVGEKELRAQLKRVLESDLNNHSRQLRQLIQLTEMIENGYLERWLDSIHSTTKPSPERLARAIASHLLDMGYSRRHLMHWIKNLRRDNAALSEILEEAQKLAIGTKNRYEVVVPFLAKPNSSEEVLISSSWMDAHATSIWMDENNIRSNIRHNGGFVYKIDALDIYAAATEASEIVDRLKARSTFAKNGIPKPAENVWISGYKKEIELGRPNRGTYVLSLANEGKLYEVTERTALDNALELATALNHGAPGPAVSGGWSALESLLISPKDKEDGGGKGNIAATRMAHLVACSWPRGELTQISYAHNPEKPDRLSRELKAAKTNRERSHLVEDALKNGRTIAASKASDIAAVSRMSALVKNPRSTLTDIERHVTSAMRRFYRHRNIVMHGGATSVPTLAMTLRTAAPLVGAGLDRITHAAITTGIDPLTLSTRAETSLKFVGGADGRSLSDLLE